MKKDLLVLLAILLLAALLLSGTEFQTVEEYYLTHIDDIKPDSETVFLSIRCDTVLENTENLDPALRREELLPEDGVILATTEYVLREGDTVYGLLDRAARYNRIQLEYKGTDESPFGSVYIEGIHYLYEYSCGPLSGWVYKVNGVFPNCGCSEYDLQDGDVVEWVYTCDLGRDVGCARTEQNNLPSGKREEEGGVKP